MRVAAYLQRITLIISCVHTTNAVSCAAACIHGIGVTRNISRVAVVVACGDIHCCVAVAVLVRKPFIF